MYIKFIERGKERLFDFFSFFNLIVRKKDRNFSRGSFKIFGYTDNVINVRFRGNDIYCLRKALESECIASVPL